jgi:biotin transport system substrate-specific component
MALYVLLGAVGLPFYSGGDGGVQHLWGATGGYIFGFIVAAWVVGKLAERGQDRTFLRAAPAFAAGQLVIFGFGVPWLAVSADLSASEAIAAGFTPFIVGGIVKAALAGALLPSAWRLVGRG